MVWLGLEHEIGQSKTERCFLLWGKKLNHRLNHRWDSAKGTKIRTKFNRSGFGVIKEPGCSKRTENRQTDSVDSMDSADYLTQQTNRLVALFFRETFASKIYTQKTTKSSDFFSSKSIRRAPKGTYSIVKRRWNCSFLDLELSKRALFPRLFC